MWAAIASIAASLLSKGIGGSSGGPTSIVSGAPNFVDASFDSSQWTVSTGSSSARAENSKVDVPPVAAAGLAMQSQAPYVDAGIVPTQAGFGGLTIESVLPVVLLGAGLAIVMSRKG